MKNSKKTLKSILIPTALIFTLAIGIFIGMQILIQTFANDEGNIIGQQPVRQGFPVNKNGQTYGSSMGCSQPEDYPDLIRVLATNDKEGYIYYTDWEETNRPPESPEATAAYMEEMEKLNERGIFAIVLPVYDLDGTTVIGEYEISIDTGYVMKDESSDSN